MTVLLRVLRFTVVLRRLRWVRRGRRTLLRQCGSGPSARRTSGLRRVTRLRRSLLRLILRLISTSLYTSVLLRSWRVLASVVLDKTDGCLCYAMIVIFATTVIAGRGTIAIMIAGYDSRGIIIACVVIMMITFCWIGNLSCLLMLLIMMINIDRQYIQFFLHVSIHVYTRGVVALGHRGRGQKHSF